MWTTEQARQWSRTASDAAKAAREKRKRDRTNYPEPETDAEQLTRAHEVVEMIRVEVNRTHQVLGRKSLKPKDRAAILGVWERLLERERVWSQRPGPGIVRDKPPRRSAPILPMLLPSVTVTELPVAPAPEPEPGKPGNGTPG